MTKYLIVLLICLPGVILGQNIKAGIILGINASQVDGDDRAGFHKIGLNSGVTAQVPFSKKFSMSLELLFNQKGSQKHANNKSPVLDSYKLILDYVDVPILVNYHDNERVFFAIGFSYGRLLKFREFEDEEETTESFSATPYKKTDINFLGGANYIFAKRWVVNLRYAYSMNASRTKRSKFHNLLSLRLIYLIKPELIKQSP